MKVLAKIEMLHGLKHNRRAPEHRELLAVDEGC